MAAKKKIPGFEEELERLEAIAEEMENGNASLEVLCARYDEGMKLAEELKKRLTAAACRLKTVRQDEHGILLEETSLADSEIPGDFEDEDKDGDDNNELLPLL